MVSSHTAVQVARLGAGITPAGDILDALLLAPMDGSMTGNKEREKLAEQLGINPRRLAQMSRMLQQNLDTLDGLGWTNSKDSGVAAAGAGLGVAAVSWLGGPVTGIPGTIASIGGSIAGGLGARKIYDTVTYPFKHEERVAVGGVALIIKMNEIQQKAMQEGKPAAEIPAQVVFAALMANLPPDVRADFEKDLKERTGTKYFHEAVEQGKLDELTAMMQDKKYEDALRKATGLPLDMSNPDKTVPEQYAEFINSGELKAGMLFKNRSVEAARLVMDRRSGGSVSGGDVGKLATNMKRMGIVPTPSDATQELPPADNERSLSA